MLSEIDEETYCTYLYLYDGHLKELFMREGASLGGQVLPAGTDIMDLQEFSLSYASDDLIRISLRTASGEDHTFISTCTVILPQNRNRTERIPNLL